MNPKNIFETELLPAPEGDELFEVLCKSPNIKIKRIISTGQKTPLGKWYDQKENEWAILLQGFSSIEFESGIVVDLKPGDYLFFASGTKHRVAFTSLNPPCIWLAVYYTD